MILNLKDISLTYPNGKQALKGIDLCLESPNLIGLLGPNGAGKSTLMKLLVAALLPTKGEILLNGESLIKQEQILKASLGYLPQTFGLYDELTVWQFLDYMSALKGITQSREEIEKTILAVNLEEKRKTSIRSLSGGQRQRVGIASALLGSPKLLILDEPTVGLDPQERISFRNLFSRIAQDRLVLLSTHITEDLQSVCSSLVVIHSGRVLFKGRAEELIQGATGHVGVFLEEEGKGVESGLYITSRINTARGIACRGVGDVLPKHAQAAEPNLEDAYLYLIGKEGGGL